MIENLIWVPVALLLLYSLAACYFDIKSKEMPVGFWTLLVTICIPVTIFLYWIGIYPVEALAVSIVAILVLLAFFIYNFFQMADFLFLTFIVFFFVTNPISGHSIVIPTFGFFLIVATVFFAILYNFGVLNRIVDKDPITGEVRFPAMLQITLALWLTVIFA